MSANHDHASGELPYAPDVDNRALTTIALYTAVLSAVFFGSLAALFVYFRWEADQELARKTLSAPGVFSTGEQIPTATQRNAAQDALSGKPLSGAGTAMPIDEAMRRTVEQFQSEQRPADKVQGDKAQTPPKEKAQ